MFVRAHGLVRAGAMRLLAEQVSSTKPDLLVVSEIDDGDALAVATRFDLQWAYRGGQAVLWNARLAPRSVEESYLPPALPALQWRGLLRVDLRSGDAELSILTTRFAADRTRIRDLRFVRSVLRRDSTSSAILFVTNPPKSGSWAFSDLGFLPKNASVANDMLLAGRRCDLRTSGKIAGGHNLGAQMIANVRVTSE